MAKNIRESFFARLRRKSFDRRINWEIFDRIFAHLEREKNWGYSFTTDEEMEAQTKELDAQVLLNTIEAQIRNMPDSYGEAFRFVLHRDLREFLERYERVARRRIQLSNDSPTRLVAPRRLELSQ